MDPQKRADLIERLAMIEFDMEEIRKRMPSELDSFDKLLNSIDEINKLGMQRDETKAQLNGL